MHDIRADAEKNRLYISLGESNGTEMAALLGEADRACRRLRPDFTCLMHFQPGKLLRRRDEGVIFRLQNILHSNGLGKAVYVRPEGSVIGRFQLEMLHIRSQCPGQDAVTVEEGEALLDTA